MTHLQAPRRDILKLGFLTGGGLLLGISLPSLARRAHAEGAEFAPNAFIRITPDNAITLVMPDTESGQGIYTSAATLIAEELEVGLNQVALMAAPPNNALYASPLLEEQATGGSASIRGDWERLRKAGASARIMLMAAAAEQWNVDPSACRAAQGAVHHDASGRSATYGQLAEAAGRIPVPKDVKLKAPADWTLIGKTQKRLDTPGKVNGATKFGIDIQVPGMKIGTVMAAPVIGGKLLGIDEASAKSVPGVRDVVKLPDAVAVIGDHMWAAIQGLAAADPQWNEGPNAHVNTADIYASMAQASDGDGAKVAKDTGDALKKIADSASKVEAAYQLPFLSHAPMEPINTTIHVRPDGADLWVGTQVPVRAQNAVATVTGLKPEQVSVHNQLMGGAFGRRLDVDSILQAAAIAKQVSYPVKLVWTREEDIRRDLFRPAYYDKMTAGLDVDGKITAWHHRTTGNSVLARWAPAGMPKDGIDPDTVECATDTPYGLDAAKVEWMPHDPAGVITAWWRGVGPVHNVFMVESFIDECAAAAKKDPVDYRRSMLGKSPRAVAVLNLAAEKAGWGRKLPSGHGMGVSLQFAFGSYLAHILEVAVSDKGEITLVRSVAAIDCGYRVNPDTVEAQIQGGIIFGLTMAMYGEITHENGRVQQANFNNYRMLRIDQAPKIEVYQVESTESPGGIGETGTAASAAALTNAIYAATGRRLRTIPVGNGALQSS
jgi:isoquinoline 1-oxidoreductase beta subunit